MSRKKPVQGKKGGQERWLLTYADLITLLMVFFVVLYALSNVNAKKFEAVAMSLAQAMGGGQSMLPHPGASLAPGISGSDPLEGIDFSTEAVEYMNLEQIRQELQDYIEQSGLGGKVTVTMEERGVVLSFQDVALFPLGSAEITPGAKEIIAKAGQILINGPWYIRVEGHTDNLPIRTSQYPSNWELSVARSTSVVQELIRELDFKPQRLSATGYGEFRPKAPNDSDQNRQTNRRVDLVILKSKYETAEPPVQKIPVGDVIGDTNNN